MKDSQIIVTIAPGKSMEWLESKFGKQVKIIRTMPNTPALVGEGMTLIEQAHTLKEEEFDLRFLKLGG